MKRSPTSLVSNKKKKIIGLIFGRETSHDRVRNAHAIEKAFKKAEEVNGIVYFLKQCENESIQREIEYCSKIDNVPFYEYFPKPEEFGGSIRAARRVCIDAILSESYYSYFLMIEDDPLCTLTRIVNDPSLSYRINVTYVRKPEKIKEDEALEKEAIWQKFMEFKRKELEDDLKAPPSAELLGLRLYYKYTI